MTGAAGGFRRCLGAAWLGLGLACAGALARAQQALPLPEPLTLEAALALASEGHPDIQIAEAELADSQALRLLQDSEYDTRVFLQLRAQWIGPSEVATDQSSDDHRISLHARRTLYDFGRTSAALAAAESSVDRSRWDLVSARDRHRHAIMQTYFRVLLADLRTAAATENMTVAFLRYDRLRERGLLGQVSDVDLLEAEALYQRLLTERDRAQADQRATRAQLAEVLDRPGALSTNLLEPPLADREQQVPAYEALLGRALSGNPGMQAARAALQAAQHQLQAARAGGRPLLSADAEVAEYSRVETGSDEWRVSIQLEVPLLAGGQVAARAQVARARMQRRRAELRALEAEIRQAVLEAWQQIRLLDGRRRSARAQQDFRDLYLDRSRALYELERRSDLGDAMARFSEARLEVAEVEYALLLAWEQLRGLLGVPPTSDWRMSLPTADTEEG